MEVVYFGKGGGSRGDERKREGRREKRKEKRNGEGGGVKAKKGMKWKSVAELNWVLLELVGDISSMIYVLDI